MPATLLLVLELTSHRTRITRTISVYPTKILCWPKREFLNGHPFIHIHGPVYGHILFYDSYRKWTPHYSFISWNHKNNRVIERLKFKKSLWEYLSPTPLLLFYLFFIFFNNGILAKRSVLIHKKNNTKRNTKDNLPLGFVYLRHWVPAYSWSNCKYKSIFK